MADWIIRIIVSNAKTNLVLLSKILFRKLFRTNLTIRLTLIWILGTDNSVLFCLQNTLDLDILFPALLTRRHNMSLAKGPGFFLRLEEKLKEQPKTELYFVHLLYHPSGDHMDSSADIREEYYTLSTSAGD